MGVLYVILYNMTICSVYPIENYNRGMGGNSNFARPMLPTYRGCTVFGVDYNALSISSHIQYILRKWDYKRHQHTLQ